jgi:hypothetical protein
MVNLLHPAFGQPIPPYSLLIWSQYTTSSFQILPSVEKIFTKKAAKWAAADKLLNLDKRQIAWA